MVLFKTENLAFRYPDSRQKSLSGLNLEIEAGEFILVMGESGSGKSTLLKLLNPKTAPFGEAEGKIKVNAGEIGFVCQNPSLSFVSETVRSELAFALENRGLDNNTISMKIGEGASFFNLSDMLDRKISTLSGGERAAVAIAAAMINNPDVIILDEPMAQLDSKAAFDLINILKRLNNELGVTVIISSHISDGIIDACDRLLVLKNGENIFFDRPVSAVDSVMPFMPLSARLFGSDVLTVKQAVPRAEGLREKKPQRQEQSRVVVKLKNVTFSYGKNQKNVLDFLSFTAFDKKIHAVIGSNGSGKTTLLKVIAGIEKQQSGKLVIDGRMAYLPQNPVYLFTKDTVGEEADNDALRKFGLERYCDMHPYDLSEGQKQKLALAILSRGEYDILLLDEPSKALDTFSKKELTDFLKNLGKTVIFVSHDLDFVGDTADYVSFLSDGAITAAGDRREVLSGLSFYTTQLRRITRRCLSSAVSREDLI